jgi:hypothetical protein
MVWFAPRNWGYPPCAGTAFLRLLLRVAHRDRLQRRRRRRCRPGEQLGYGRAELLHSGWRLYERGCILLDRHSRSSSRVQSRAPSAPFLRSLCSLSPPPDFCLLTSSCLLLPAAERSAHRRPRQRVATAAVRPAGPAPTSTTPCGSAAKSAGHKPMRMIAIPSQVPVRRGRLVTDASVALYSAPPASTSRIQYLHLLISAILLT